MRIVKPYGETRAEDRSGEGLKRYLYRNDGSQTPVGLEEFARNNTELVIAQWISAIDKIATKPAGTNGATKEQREFRDRLGKAAWKVLTDRELIASADANDELVKKLWNFKIHPYGTAEYKPKTGSKGKNEPNPKGRLYKRFAGDVDVKDADAMEIARKIDSHLNDKEMRNSEQNRPHEMGLISRRATSITKNTLQLANEKTADKFQCEWNESHVKQYFEDGDVAQEISNEAKKHKNEGKPFRHAHAAALLSKHWTRVFGKYVQTKNDAKDRFPELLALHLSVCDAYRAKLKRRTKPASETKLTPASKILPHDKGALIRLVEQLRANRKVADLIRRGKLIHYSANDGTGAADDIAETLSNWPVDITTSRFRTSNGQSAIKRSEAFVRIWRHAVALASLTLRDWASMREGDIGDVLGNGSMFERAVGKKNFDAAKHLAKVKLLFGNRAEKFDTNEEAQKFFLSAAIKLAFAIRCSVFHFKGRKGLLDALEKTVHNKTLDSGTLDAMKEIWKLDATDRSGRIRAALTAADAGFFFELEQNKQLLEILERQHFEDAIPIPRFRRVLSRAENAWKGTESLNPEYTTLLETRNEKDSN